MVHVLVVDDDPAIRKMITEVLTLEGYIVVGGAADGREALKALRASPHPLVVITDNTMPFMSGLEMLETVAQDPVLATRHVYVMATPRLRTGEDADVLKRLHVPVVQSPFTVDQIVSVIEAAAKRLPCEE
jgi:CheY-like chemotaxis protein